MSANRLQAGATRLHARMKAHAGVTVTYRRPATGDEVSVTATVGRTPFRLDRGPAGVIRVVMRDYLIDTTDLVLDGAQVEPRGGDEIVETVGTQTLTYTVTSPGEGETAWRYTDGFHGRLRVHTKLTKTE